MLDRMVEKALRKLLFPKACSAGATVAGPKDGQNWTPDL